MRREVQIARFWLNSCRVSQSLGSCAAIRSEALVTRMLLLLTSYQALLFRLRHFQRKSLLAGYGLTRFLNFLSARLQKITHFLRRHWSSGKAKNVRSRLLWVPFRQTATAQYFTMAIAYRKVQRTKKYHWNLSWLARLMAQVALCSLFSINPFQPKGFPIDE